MRSGLKRALGLWLGLGLGALMCCSAVRAQEAHSLPSDTTNLACMTKPAKPPKYPERDLEKNASAFFRVQLTFARPDKAPEVKFLFLSGSPAMQEEIESYVAGMRLPCLNEGGTVAIVQEFRFRTQVADADVGQATTLETRGERLNDLSSCMRTAPERGVVQLEQQTGTMFKKKYSGNVLATARFTRGDAPPEVKVIYRSGPYALEAEVVDSLKQYRLPCMHPDDPPYQFVQQFSLTDESRTDHAFKDAGLVTFLQAVKDVDAQHVNFQLDTMACPFKVKWTMYRPAMDNDVREVGKPNPNRALFLKWLSGLSLNIGKDAFEQLLGQTMVITVPCGTVEL